MDEDEREMLSEARARLANTKGKKAKRKAREKQLEEARRLASLQKKRELKAAGIETVKRAKRVRGIDYNAEIAFERKPAPGFYDVTEERLAQPDPFDEKNFKPTTVEEMEGPRKKDLEEKLRAQDVKRQRINERRDAPSAVATTNALNDPSAVRRRSKLMLPEPQVSDRELEEMAKMGGAAMMDVDADDDTPGSALVSRYGVPPASSSGAVSARTPQVGGHDAILQEAQNLRRLAEGQTPLLGGENPTLAGSDFSGITPARRDAPTPNPLAGATPARGFAGATPSAARHRAGIDSVGATPLRDSLNINDPDAMLAPPEGRAGKARDTLARNELRESLASLPAPMNEYQVMIPDLPEENDEGAGLAMEEDMGDVLAREAAARAEEEAAELRRRSAAICRGTPRPTPESRGPAAAAAGGGDPTEAETLIAAELALVLEHDAAKYPAKKERRPRAVPHLPRVEEQETAAAAALVAREAEAVRRAMGHADADDEEYARAAVAVRGDWIVHAETGEPVPRRAAKPADRVAAAAAEHSRLRAEMEKDAKRAAKLEHKVELLTAGLRKRAEALGAQLVDLGAKIAEAEEERAAYGALHEQEQRAAPRRMEELMELTASASARERGLQETYRARAEALAAAKSGA